MSTWLRSNQPNRDFQPKTKKAVANCHQFKQAETNKKTISKGGHFGGQVKQHKGSSKIILSVKGKLQVKYKRNQYSVDSKTLRIETALPFSLYCT